MKIKLSNLGPIVTGEFDLTELTVICGHNNTGKTYATYALFGFLAFWNEGYEIPIKKELYEEIYDDGNVTIDLKPFLKARNEILEQAGNHYKKFLPTIFASNEENFSDSSFHIELDEPETCPLPEYKKSLGSTKNEIFNLIKKEGSTDLEVTLLMELSGKDLHDHPVDQIIGAAVKEILFSHLLPVPFIASAERTGAAIFKKHLNFARNNLLEQMNTIEREVDTFRVMQDSASEYAVPVRRDVDFNRNLDSVSKQKSEIVETNPDIIDLFAKIIGGRYVLNKQSELQFIPNSNKRAKLSMDESSSTVRSMLDIGFYIHHVAKKTDILMIDEPELNLHPENQRLFALLINRLRRFGIRVFLTTHSDYIIKEFNTLIMLKKDLPHVESIRKMAEYSENDILDYKKVSVYIAETDLRTLPGAKNRKRVPTLNKIEVDEDQGIHARSFDDTIDRMNRIQRALYFGKEEF